MKTRPPAWTVALAVCAAALLGLTWNAGTAVGSARTTRLAPPTPVIATVNLEKVVNALTERQDKETAFKATVDKRLNDLKTMVEEIKAEQEKIKVMAAGPAKVAAERALDEKAAQVRISQGVWDKMLGQLQGDLLRELFIKVETAIADLASKNGYSLVISNDSQVEIPEGGSSEAVQSMIARKRFLFADTNLDVTQEVITFMNNQYAAGK